MKKPDRAYQEVVYSDEYRAMSWGLGTVHLLEGQCVLCGDKTTVLEADPEQAGLSVVSMCRNCIDRKFEDFAGRFGA